MKATIQDVIDLFNAISTTNVRIFVTMLAMLCTTVSYVFIHATTGGWVPNYNWLIFLASMAGLDALQYFGKRMTTFTPDGETVASKIRAAGIPATTETLITGPTLTKKE